MYYGDEIINEVQSRNSIVDLIGTYVSLKRAGKSYKGLCPFHNEKTPSFTVDPDKQMFYCFGCHKGGNIYTFLMEYENMSFVEAIRFLAERAGIELPSESSSPEIRKEISLREQIFKLNALAGNYYYATLRDPKGRDGMEYLRSRGINDEMMKKFALGFAPKTGEFYRYCKSKGYTDDILKESGLFVYDKTKGARDKFWNRVMYPIVDRRGHVIGFGGRVMGDGEPKYLNSPETKVFEKSKNLYGINYLHGKLPQGIILCEGYMDVIAMHQAGFDNAVAALGTAFTPYHASLIKKYTDLVYVCFDSDGAGTKAAMRAIPILRGEGIKTKVISLTPYKDPDEFIKDKSAEEFGERIRDAKISFYFETEVISRDYDMDDPEDKTAFMKNIAKRILGFEDEVTRSNYIEAFSREYGVRTEDFRALVIRMSASLIGREVNESKQTDDHYKGNKESGIDESQGILLTWLCEHPESFEKLREYVGPDDFADEPYRLVARLVYEQLSEKQGVDVASICSKFEDPDDQSVVAGIFHKEVSDDRYLQGRVIEDVVRGILKNSIDRRSAGATALGDIQKLLEDKKKLENIQIRL